MPEDSTSQTLSDIEARARSFESLAATHYEPLLRLATRLSGSAGEGSDLVQDTFERALRRFDSFEHGTNARAWLYSILHNAFIDHCRRRVETLPVEAADFAAPAEDEEAAPPRWSSISPDQLRVAMDGLTPDFRAVYTMHALEDRSYREIAVALGIPGNTVGTRLARARRKLKALLLEMTGTQGKIE